MVATTNHLAWAERIKRQVNAEFDRVAALFHDWSEIGIRCGSYSSGIPATKQSKRRKREHEQIMKILPLHFLCTSSALWVPPLYCQESQLTNLDG